jgi:hypothetical protein
MEKRYVSTRKNQKVQAHKHGSMEAIRMQGNDVNLFVVEFDFLEACHD